MGVVSGKSGYPVEKQDPSMQLDADLGIDSIKRVEILSALQERLPGAPAVRPGLLYTSDAVDELGGVVVGCRGATPQHAPAGPAGSRGVSRGVGSRRRRPRGRGGHGGQGVRRTEG